MAGALRRGEETRHIFPFMRLSSGHVSHDIPFSSDLLGISLVKVVEVVEVDDVVGFFFRLLLERERVIM